MKLEIEVSDKAAASLKSAMARINPKISKIELMQRRFDLAFDYLTPHQAEDYMIRVMRGALHKPTR